jgi:dolichol-phosphate mannosyltransferase
MSMYSMARPDEPTPEPQYYYDIDGLLTIESAVRLPELAFFRVLKAKNPDLVIEIKGPRRPHLRTFAMIHPPAARLRYREQVGDLGANFDIYIGTPIHVVVTRLLAFSPHVLYTNIIEALLRFILLSKDHMLLHAACLGLDGQGVLLSAKTDTGKTSTLLRLLQDDANGVFYSDDMTIINADGIAQRYPKPLTISKHTVSALQIDRLTRKQRAALAIQSRLHSRSGRTVGKRIAQSPLPIMAINSIVQAAIPPPKYMVTDLIDTRIGDKTSIDRLFVIARGEPRAETLDQGEIVEQLLENTEDAYGFPPYQQLAPLISVGGISNDVLRLREREILTAAMSNVPCERITLPDFSWPTVVRDRLTRAMEVRGVDTAKVAYAV